MTVVGELGMVGGDIRHALHNLRMLTPVVGGAVLSAAVCSLERALAAVEGVRRELSAGVTV